MIKITNTIIFVFFISGQRGEGGGGGAIYLLNPHSVFEYRHLTLAIHESTAAK